MSLPSVSTMALPALTRTVSCTGIGAPTLSESELLKIEEE